MTNSPTLLFAYGSLRSGEYNHGLLRNSTKIADAFIEGFRLYSLGAFPAVISSGNPDRDRVIGEVFEVDPTEFTRIDGMERGAGYTAHKIAPESLDADEELLPCLIYVFRDANWLQDVAEVVPSGDWVKRGER